MLVSAQAVESKIWEQVVDIERLTNPPIVEATIERRFARTDKVTLQQLQDFANLEAGAYPTQEPLYAGAIQRRIADTSPPQTALALQTGFRLRNINDSRIVLASLDRIAVTVKAPYPSWETLEEHAKHVFQSFDQKIGHGPLVRAGMRYVNRIDIPIKEELDLDEYLATMPRLPKHEEIPDAIEGFETVVVIPFRQIEPKGPVIIRQLLYPPETAQDGTRRLPLILDIDAYCEDGNGLASSDIWSVMHALRKRKNRVFFSSVTERALEPYL